MTRVTFAYDTCHISSYDTCNISSYVIIKLKSDLHSGFGGDRGGRGRGEYRGRGRGGMDGGATLSQIQIKYKHKYKYGSNTNTNIDGGANGFDMHLRPDLPCHCHWQRSAWPWRPPPKTQAKTIIASNCLFVRWFLKDIWLNHKNIGKNIVFEEKPKTDWKAPDTPK